MLIFLLYFDNALPTLQLFYPPIQVEWTFFSETNKLLLYEKFYRFSSGLSFSPFFSAWAAVSSGWTQWPAFLWRNLNYEFGILISTLPLYFFTESKLSSYGELIFGTIPCKRNELEDKAKNIKNSIISCVTDKSFGAFYRSEGIQHALCVVCKLC